MKTKKKKKKPTAFKCKQCLGYFPINKKTTHVCEVPTESAVLSVLEQEPLQAWIKLRKFASSLGSQKIYCSSKAIMFAREVCYLFVRPKKKKLELFVMLNREIQNPMVKKIDSYSKTRFRHAIDIYHEDSIEEPLTGWIESAWNTAGK